MAFGLEVFPARGSKATDAVVTVAKGLAVNRAGHTLRLECPQTVALTRPLEKTTTVECVFADCDIQLPGGTLSLAGYYLLTIAPASKREGLAPVSGLGNAIAPCNSRYFTEGVQFRLIPLKVNPGADARRARNVAAYQCFGRPAKQPLQFLHEAFGVSPATEYGLETLVAGAKLTEHDVPLALIEWKGEAGLGVIDEWAARRPIARPNATDEWGYFAAERRLGEAIAMFLQFQDHLASFSPATAPLASVVARDHFDWLPAGGLLPVKSGQFDAKKFFQGLTVQEKCSELAFLRWLLWESFLLEPINLAAPPHVIDLITFAETKDYILFLRGEPAPCPTVTPTQPPTQVEPKPDKGQFVIRITAEKGASVIPQDIKVVVAQDTQRGTTHEARFIERGVKQVEGRSRGLAVERLGKEVVYLTELIPPGPYLIKVQARNFAVLSQSAVLPAGHTIEVRVVLRARRVPDPKKPGLKEDFLDKFGNRYRKVKLIPKPIPPEEIYAKWKDPGYIDPVPDDVLAQIEDLLGGDPELPFSTEKPRLLIDPTHQPGKLSDEPYAFVETPGGKAMPVILTPADMTLPGEVDTARAGIPELSSENFSRKLAASGLGEMDVAAAAWGNLVAETLGIAAGSAKTLLIDLNAAIPIARANMTYYPGLSEANAKTLKDSGYDDVKLANATETELVALLGANLSDADKARMKAYSARLIGYARSVAPESSWSLKETTLGLTDEQVGNLRGQNIHTQEGFRKAIDKAADKAQFAESIGVPEGKLATFTGTVEKNLHAGRTTLAPEASLASLNSLSNETAARLVAADLTSVSKLADSSSGEVARALGVSETQADAVIKEALTATLTSKAGLSQKEAEDVVATTGATKLADIAEKDVTALTLALGGDDAATTARANELRVRTEFLRFGGARRR